MKYVSIVIAVAALILAGIIYMRTQSPAPAPEVSIVQPDPVDETVDEPQTAPPAENEGAPAELVEESAGDSAADEEQPIVLAQADAEELAGRDWQYEEGTHFSRMVPAQPTVGGADKIEVVEVFWYGCNHCFDFEPYINRWAEEVPDNARFVRMPALWNPLVKLHGQLYYTEDVLATNGKLVDRDGFRNAVFLEYHRRGNRLTSEAAIYEVFERFGVSEADFNEVWGSFEVAQKIRVAEDLARRYGVASVPMVIVNGKYRTSAAEAGSYPKLLEVIDELIAREQAIR